MNKNFISILSIVFFFTAPFNVEAYGVTYAPDQISHIKQRHWYNAKSGPQTSHFNRSMTVSKLNNMAQKAIKKGGTNNSKQGTGRKTHDYTFKKPIGRQSNGQKAYTLRVVTNQKGQIVTAFPKK